jgi:hypothetical protein
MAAKPPPEASAVGAGAKATGTHRVATQSGYLLTLRITCRLGPRRGNGGQVHARVMPLTSMRSKSSDAGSGLPMQPPQ